MIYDKEFLTHQDYMDYLVHQAIHEVETFNKKKVTIYITNEEDMEHLALVLNIIFLDSDVEIFFEIKNIH